MKKSSDKSVEEKTNKKLKLFTKKKIIIALLTIVVIVLLVWPLYNLYSANKYYNSENYEEAIKFYESSIYMNSESSNKLVYSKAKVLLEDYEYVEAAETFLSIIDYDDSEEQIYNIYLTCINKEKYGNANTVITLLEDDKYETDVKYSLALVSFYLGTYSDSVTKFNELEGYMDSQNFADISNLLIAKESIDAGKLNEAKGILETIENEVEYEGISSNNYLSILNSNKSLLEDLGTWQATSTYLRTKHVWRYNGSWDAWEISENQTAQTVTVSAVINESDKIDLTLKVTYYAYDDYSSLAAYCTPNYVTKTINIENATEIPSSYTINSNTTLKFDGSKFTLSYQETDEYSSNFYNVYTSTVAYGNQTSTY